MDEGFLDVFLAQFQKAMKRIASSEEEVLEAVACIKKASTNMKRVSHTTELNLSSPGISPSTLWLTIHSKDLYCSSNIGDSGR